MILHLMRIGAFESGMYREIAHRRISKGDFLSLFTQRRRSSNYLKSVPIGLPIWYAVGILITFSFQFLKGRMGIIHSASIGRSRLPHNRLLRTLRDRGDL